MAMVNFLRHYDIGHDGELICGLCPLEGPSAGEGGNLAELIAQATAHHRDLHDRDVDEDAPAWEAALSRATSRHAALGEAMTLLRARDLTEAAALVQALAEGWVSIPVAGCQSHISPQRGQ